MNSSSSRNSSVSPQNQLESLLCDTSSSVGILLATAIIKVEGDNGNQLMVRALIDPCSQATFISGSVCQRLKLKMNKVNVPIRGTSSVTLSNITKSVNCCCSEMLFRFLVQNGRVCPA